MPVPDSENTLGHSTYTTNQRNMTSKGFFAFLLEAICLQPNTTNHAPLLSKLDSSSIEQQKFGIFHIQEQIDRIIFNYCQLDGRL